MRNTTGLIVLSVTLVVAVGFSWSQGQVDPARVDHIRVLEAEPIEFVEPIVNQRVSLPINVRSDGTVVRQVTAQLEVPQEILQLDSDSREIAKELRELPEAESDQRQDLEKQLREKLDEEFEARMRIEQDKVNELRERLKNVERRLTEREDNRQLIIDRRFAELTGDATLAWDVYSDGRAPNTTLFEFQTPEGTKFRRAPINALSPVRRYSTTTRQRSDSEIPDAQEPRAPARPRGRVVSPTLHRRTESKRKRATLAEVEKKSSNAAALQQKAVDLQQDIQDQVQSLRESTSSGSAARHELDAAIDLLRELRDRLDGLNSLNESARP